MVYRIFLESFSVPYVLCTPLLHTQINPATRFYSMSLILKQLSSSAPPSDSYEKRSVQIRSIQHANNHSPSTPHLQLPTFKASP
jgi:hypothetical protein